LILSSTCTRLVRRARARVIRLGGVCARVLARFRAVVIEQVLRLVSREFWKPRLRVPIAAGFLALSAAFACTQVARIAEFRGRYLYFPEGWAFGVPSRPAGRRAESRSGPSEVDSVGGGSLGVLPLHIKYYRVHRGDTLSGIAERFNVDLDTIASLNREWGSGVHLVRVGEEIKVPNQDGIFIEIDSALEKVCTEHGIPEEVVLQVNRVSAEQAKPGVSLFFPGVQHTGIERSVITGTAFLRPVAGWLTSGFGYRKDPFSERVQFHRGLDIAAAVGTTVRASLDGRVVAAGWDPVLGNFLMIRHQIGYATLYGHLHQALVSRGDTVTRGQRIGTVGTTGRSTGPHLHFEIRRSGLPINPSALLTSKF
jgi:murein DD-endopeptidase MepM/ murein hydrolase activator NlpD